MNGVKWAKISSQHDNIIIVCTGPSLKTFDLNRLKGLGHIIAVNDAGKHMDFADSWFTLDPWGIGLKGKQLPLPSFKGDMYAAVPDDYGLKIARYSDHRIFPNPQINFLHRITYHSSDRATPTDALNWGLNDDKRCINTGNSGFGALGLAYHMNPKNIFLLGLDASAGYFFDEGKNTRSLSHLPVMFQSAVPQLEAKGIRVYNASMNSKIQCFQKCTLAEAVKTLKELN